MPYSFATSTTDRTAAILRGAVSHPDVPLSIQRLSIDEIFLKQANDAVFDIAECSLASYLIAIGRGEKRLTAIPVFPSRIFRHDQVFVRADSPIHKFEDLRGKRFGLPEFQLTAAVWLRAHFRDAGVRNQDIDWVTFRAERVPIPTPARLGTKEDVYSALMDGEVDACFSPRRPPLKLFPRTGKGGPLRRLLANPWAEERAYYQRTKFFPMAHVITLRTETVKAAPKLPRAVYDLFVEAKAKALESVSTVGILPFMSPFLGEGLEQAFDLMGTDLWPYGFKTAWPEVTAFMKYMEEDGLLEHALKPEEIFDSSIFDT